jgi:pimeloyl-ACP methyl ester carboxylesterase
MAGGRVRRGLAAAATVVLFAAGHASPAVASGGPQGGPSLEPPPPASPRGHFRAWTGLPSDVAGGVAYSRGEVIVTDDPFDDHGADTRPNADPSELVTGPGQGANAALGYTPVTGGANGDATYPAGPAYARNAADIVETRLAADAHAWYLLVRLNTLLDPARTAVEARIDGHVLLAHGQAATFDGRPVEAVGDAGQSLFEVKVPRAVYDPGTGTQRVFVAAGLWDDANGISPLYDLAYVPAEGMGSYWRDARQSADLAAGTFADDAFSVDFGAPADARGYSGPSEGLFSRVFRSGQPLGHGVTLQGRYGQDTGSSPPNLYRSPYQPYSIYVPRHPTGGLVLLLHFLGGNYMSYPLTSTPGLARWAEKLGVIVAMPLARGEGGWYEGEAEKDVFEVWRDVASHYTVDRDRVYLAGMSMGGFGTWRLAQLYPDLFARGIVWSGPVVPDTFWAYPAEPIPPSCSAEQGPNCGYNLVDLFGNTRDVPLLVVHGGGDELVTSTGAEHWMGLYAARSGATYRYLFYPGRRHETSYPGTTSPWVEDWLAGLPRRQTNPVHVTYKVIRALAQPRFGITYERAYWVSGIALAAGAATGTVDASRATAPERVAALHDAYGADALGPYRLNGQDVTPAPASADRVRLELTRVARVTLDTRRMGWTARAPQHVTGRTDTPVTLTLAGRRRVTLALAPGPFDVTVPAVRNVHD